MSNKRRDVTGITGIVSEVFKYKAVVCFGLEDKHEQAILKMDKLSIGGRRVRAECLTDVLSVGSVVKFWAHTLFKVGVDNCDWFITHAFLRDYNGEFGCETGIIRETAEFLQGLYCHVGRIDELDDRTGTISSSGSSGDTHRVYFTASKFFCHGKNFSPQGKLPEALKQHDVVFFDAIPANPKENAKACEWFATLVWIGKRPAAYNSSVLHTDVNLRELISGSNYNTFLYQLCDAKASFVKAEGRVMFLINHEFGVALLLMKTNVLQTALFHRNDTIFFGHYMSNCDLRKFFKEGDRIKFIGVEAPDGLLTKFVAAEVSVYRP